MDGEGAMENVTGKLEKKIKPKYKKGKKNEESTMGIQEDQDIGIPSVIEHARVFDKEDTAEMKRHHKREKEKKKNKGTKDAGANVQKSPREDELTGAYGEDGSVDGMDNAERKGKKRDKNKNKNDRFEKINTEEVGEKDSEKWPEGESVSRMKSGREGKKERKNQKAMRSHEDGDENEGENYVEEVGTHNLTEMVERKKRKREKKKNKDDNCFGMQETYIEAKEPMIDDDSTTKRTVVNESEYKKTPGTLIEGHNDDLSEKVDKEKKRKKKKTEAMEENDEGDLLLQQENMLGTLTEGHKDGFSEKADRKKKKKATIENNEGDLSSLHSEKADIKKKKKSRKDDNEGDLSSLHSEKADIKKKKKKARKDDNEGDLSSFQQERVPENVGGSIQSTKRDGDAIKKLERKKKYKDDSPAGLLDISMQDTVDNNKLHADEMQNNEAEDASKGKKKKAKLVENGSDIIQDNEVEYSKKEKKRKVKLVENGSNDPTPNKSNKKVRFSGQVDVFPIPGDSNTEEGNMDEDNLVRGKRFTPEEDEIIKEAVYKYIEEHDLGDEGLHMVLNSRRYSKVRGCWKEIGSAIPYRPTEASYFRAQILFRRSETRKWSKEEYELVLNHQKEHGNQWRALADELGKHSWHVKDTWRRIKLQNVNKGHWTQEEYQKLFDLVNTDLQSKVHEEKRSKHGMLRDNICWTAISDELATRPQASCCNKWYQQLTSPMVADGLWADTDDYRLIDALYSLDATCMEDVDWDDLLDDRSGDVCKKRWNQMILHIGRHGNRSFAEQVEVLAQRYCPHLLEVREAWDSKPRVP